MITEDQMPFWVIMGLIIVQFYVMGVMLISHDERIFQELQKLSACKQDTSVLINPETRYQVGSFRSGSERSQAR
jgi:hypothetical protein